mmetsp:Transcript_31590/g.69185  ORF Transcript_31590/g.69185 Transcript_31590/m.69185 type:complete len:391 (-) Transcript_31590:10-1182(-)
MRGWIWALCIAAVCRGEQCVLTALALRSGDLPIDIFPLFEPRIFEYTATLDFAMSEYELDAFAANGCTVDDKPKGPQTLHIGETHLVTLASRNFQTGEVSQYRVKVHRLIGSEPEVQLLNVVGAEMKPAFDPSTKHYVAALDVGYDTAVVEFVTRDSSQRVLFSAQPELPGQPHHLIAAAERTEKLDGGTAPLIQLFNRTGESQFRKQVTRFFIDPGFHRQVTITVQSADALAAIVSVYEVVVYRIECKATQPYFDPTQRLCTRQCSPGYYKAGATHRCSRCNTHCLKCSSLLKCEMCESDTEDFNYKVQPDGSCREIVKHEYKVYKVWAFGLACLFVFLVCMGVGIIHRCCTRRHSVRVYVESSDDSDFSDGAEHAFAGPTEGKPYRVE